MTDVDRVWIEARTLPGRHGPAMAAYREGGVAPVPDGRYVHESELARVVGERDRYREERDRLAAAALAYLGFGNPAGIPDVLTVIEELGLRP